MPSLSPTDAQLLQIVSAPNPTLIAEVVALMQSIDALLPSDDGLKWFNKLYLIVTQKIDEQSPDGVWKDPKWLTRLDVVFANLYFSAMVGTLEGKADVASSWRALFEARHVPDIERIQFALAGMNAHINHDLALALVQTDQELGLTPALQSPEHADYQRVNLLLEQVLPSALQFLATGILGELAQDTGRIGQLLAIWNVSVARDLAWNFAGHLRGLEGVDREIALVAQDKLTGVVGRLLLRP